VARPDGTNPRPHAKLIPSLLQAYPKTQTDPVHESLPSFTEESAEQFAAWIPKYPLLDLHLVIELGVVYHR
jgi:hypothetical protein